MDELYDLNQSMNDENDSWFILKPAMWVLVYINSACWYHIRADRANGIRLFNSEETLREIFEEFDSDSEDEDEDEDEESTAVSTSQLRHFVIQVGPS